MKVDTYVDKAISYSVRNENTQSEVNYVSSGKLSASQLGWPLQWQVLKSMGIKPPPPDDYTLRKFARGNHVEDWFVSKVPDIVDKQKKVHYRSATGRYDLLVDTAHWDFNLGIIPIEVKSVTNAKFKYIQQRKETDRGHLLQGGFYACALDKQAFAIAYIASDDYRIRIHIHNVKDVRKDIDAIITRFENQRALGTVPVFAPEEPWQANIKYNMYPEWATLKDDEIMSKLEQYAGTSTRQ